MWFKRQAHARRPIAAGIIVLLVLPLSVLAQKNSPVLVPVRADAEWRSFVDNEVWARRNEILRGIRYSLNYLKTEGAAAAYGRLQDPNIELKTVVRSLKRVRHILEKSRSAEQLYTALMDEFEVRRSIGYDGRGTVRFTAYFQPMYYASRTPDHEYRYPIFRLPPDFPEWQPPHPTRVRLEGYDGTGAGGLLEGLEIAYLRTRFEAFMIHVQGSALLQLKDGGKIAVGYAANTAYPFVGFVPSCLARKPRGLSVRDFFTARPDELHRCLARNNRYIFFNEKETFDAIGSLGVPVVPECSIATDKTHLPPGALALVRTRLPQQREDGSIEMRLTSRIVLDHDTGGAIRGPGRADVFMGSGPEAGRKATMVSNDGQLYYFFLKEEPPRIEKRLQMP